MILLQKEMEIVVQWYSAAKKKPYKYCFMKQKCQIQMGIVQYENVATTLSNKGINTTHQHF